MIFKVSILAVIAAIIAVGFKKEHAHFSVLILIAGSVLLGVFTLGAVFETIAPIA